MREILLTTTFRDFQDDKNSRIQIEVLKSLKAQTYQNYRLIVTGFGEKNVKKTLENMKIKHEYIESPRTNYLKENKLFFSFSEVVSNGFQFIEQDKHIFMWTTADNIFKPNFFQEIINNFEPGCGGTSYPHLRFLEMEDMKINKQYELLQDEFVYSYKAYDPNRYVPDVVYVDGNVFINEKNRQDFLDVTMDGAWPGMASSVMICSYAQKVKNLFFISPVSTVENARPDTQTKSSKNVVVHDKNLLLLYKFCEQRQLPWIYWKPWPYRKFFQHYRYKIVGTIFQKYDFNMYMLKYFLKRFIRLPYKLVRKLFK